MFFSLFLRTIRLRSFLVLAVLFLAFAPVAFAQADAPAPSAGINFELFGTLLSAIAVALVGLYAIGRDLVGRMAARPEVDGWDKAKAVFEKLDPWAETLAKIADPKDPTTAPTPTNPTGVVK